MSLLWSDTVTWVRRRLDGRDQYGNDVYIDERVPLHGVCWQTVDSSEDETTTRDTVTAHFRLYIRGFTNVHPTDAFEHRGIVAEVHGRPEQQRSPTGRLTHTAIHLRHVRG
ncbi:hypothetical protein HNR23_002238 [Nocardiopsis mwathae]|uniref:Head-to-tail stopper n=1 Tax=Nocardiopsis mwathae TaxID=1472723 RepID=A0A7W9YHD0_9ACTN|nr:hypothetical protein [Nocardiopsis mwathae]MBB6172178.1 hypothetical protein [Nocardiopsis mwathae]